jgi:hypothetical protein
MLDSVACAATAVVVPNPNEPYSSKLMVMRVLKAEVKKD